MEQTPLCKASSSTVRQEIPHTLWKLKVLHYLHNSPPSVPMLSQINPVVPLTYFFKVNLNTIFHLCLGLANGLFPSNFPTKTLYTSLFFP